MRGTRYRKTASKRLALAWGLLLSVYVAIGMAPTAGAATTCSLSAPTLTISLEGSVILTATNSASGVAIGFSGGAPAGCDSSYPDVTTLVVDGTSGNETVSFMEPSSMYWDVGHLTGGIDLNLSTGVDEVDLTGVNDVDDIDAGIFVTSSASGVDLVRLDPAGNPGSLPETLTGTDYAPNYFEQNTDATATVDTIVGGALVDVVDYSGRTLPVVVDLEAGVAPAPTMPNVSEDIFDGTVEHVIGTGGDDKLYGSGAANTIEGGEGEDLLYGGAGNDTFDESSDDASLDTISGQGGTLDGVEYPDRSSSVTVDLDSGTGTACATSEDSFDGTVESVVGTAHDDLLCGTAGVNLMSAGDGADMVYGDAGDDVIYGGAGDDRVGSVSDTDTVDEAGLFGGTGRDSIYGEDGDDVLSGGGSNDKLIGGVGLDYIFGGDGDDTLDGTRDSDDDRLRGDGGTKDKCAVQNTSEQASSDGCESFTGVSNKKPRP